MRAKPPQEQSKEDHPVVIRLDPEHEARKMGAFELRQTIQKLIPDGNLVSDVWTVPSGFAILAPTAAKAATILQLKSAIENGFGKAVVERQETWSTLVTDPIPKKTCCLDRAIEKGVHSPDSPVHPMAGLFQAEFASVLEVIPIRSMNRTRRSVESDEPFGGVRNCVEESKVDTRLDCASLGR